MDANAGVVGTVSESAYGVAELSDSELLASTRRLVGSSNQLFAALLAHLAEVEARGLHRTRACASLYTYCIYELRFSEDAAFRRVSAAKWVRRYPVLFDAIASGELHLTGLLLLGPHLTPENHVEVLSRAKHRTKKEIVQLVRRLDPLPEVPARIEPLGPALPPRVDFNPSWEKFMLGLNPVRHLPAGQRPRDWMTDGGMPAGVAAAELANAAAESASTAPARVEAALLASSSPPQADMSVPAPARVDAVATIAEVTSPTLARVGAVPTIAEVTSPTLARVGAVPTVAEVTSPAPARIGAALPEMEFSRSPLPRADGVVVAAVVSERSPWSGPQRYAVQFTTGDEYVKLVEHAQGLLSQTASTASLEELHFRALQALVAQLEKRKYGVRTGDSEVVALVTLRRSEGTEARSSCAKPQSAELSEDAELVARRRSEGAKVRSSSATPDWQSTQPSDDGGSGNATPRTQSAEPSTQSAEPRTQSAEPSIDSGEANPESRRRGRSIPAAVRRQVFARDGQRCAFVDDAGRRCCETRYLELHHLQAFALGGAHTAENVMLCCAAHNAFAAEKDFGRDAIARKVNAAGHESLAAQKRGE